MILLKFLCIIYLQYTTILSLLFYFGFSLSYVIFEQVLKCLSAFHPARRSYFRRRRVRKGSVLEGGQRCHGEVDGVGD